MASQEIALAEFIVRPLEDVGFERWFDIGPPPTDVSHAAAALGAELAAPGPRRQFRLVALDAAGAVRAKVGGYVTDAGRLTFWAVRHRAGEETTVRRQLTDVLVAACCARARTDERVRYIETQPAHDTPDLAVFLAALEAAQLAEVASSHLYERPPDSPTVGMAANGRSHPGLAFALAQSVAGDALERAFEAANRDTADRAARVSVLSAAETLAELRYLARAGAPPLPWWVAVEQGGNGVAGYVLCTAPPAPPGYLASAHVVEIGVVPRARRQGVARALLEHALRELELRGVRTVTSLIDDENKASIRLHQGLGFDKQSGSYHTWRLVVRRGPEQA